MEDNIDKSRVVETCVSCGAKMKGDYCRKCGEKKIIPERDFSLIKFLTQNLWHVMHLDFKLLKSVWLLFSKPGFLTSEWIVGRRVGYMKPWQLFIVAGLLFYFFLPTTPAYFSTPDDLMVGYKNHKLLMNTFNYDFEKVLSEKAIINQVNEETLKIKIASKSSEHSKTFLFLIIPFWGGLIYLFFQKKMPWMSPHLIFAIHGITFYMLTDLAIHAVLEMAGFSIPTKSIVLPLLLMIYSIFLFWAIRRVYESNLSKTLLKTVGVLAGFIIVIIIYRQMITIGTTIFFDLR
ncbi:MAG TPA: DUF3667 domain-containing protein [Saprospiraceae bacterium]|nr:DUF3667 domain-containing protein [Saprospiraceae bacterium]